MNWSRLRAAVSGRHGVAILTALGVGAAAIAALVMASGVLESPSNLQLFVGRLHPLIVHLPIGFILLSVLLEGLSRTRRFVRARHAVPLALVMSAASAIVAVLAGYLLAAGGGYSGSLVDWHMRLGIAVSVGAAVAAAMRYAATIRRSPALRLGYTLSLAATVGMVVATGHLGGTLARGADYLTEYMPAPLLALGGLLPREPVEARPTFTYSDEAVIYQHLVAPVLQARCVTCHGPEKQNGDLRLDSPEGIRAGGTSGPVIVAGRAAESRLIQRVWLPPGHEDAMPPRGRQPLSVVEGELLRWWVEEGASYEQTMAGLAPPAGVRAILEQFAGPVEERVAPILRTRVVPADSGAVAQARQLGIALRPVAAGSFFLWARCVAPEPCGSEQVGALAPLSAQLAELDLSGASINDADLEAIGQLDHLVRLSLDRTGVSDAGLSRLAGLSHLEYLNLYGTAVTDAGLPALGKLSRLRSLYLWRTEATPAGVARLSAQLPRVKASLGIDSTSVDTAASNVSAAAAPAR